MNAATVMQLRNTSLRQALLPATRTRTAFLVSLCVHVAGVALLVWVPISFQAQPAMAITTADLIHDPNYHLVMLPVLPRLRDARSSSQTKHRTQRSMHSTVGTGSTNGRQVSGPPKIDYASPQEIVSDLPNFTNNVQTIQRPDLVDPPKLKFPIRVPSLVMLPAAPAHAVATPQLAAPQVDQPSHSLPEVALNIKPTVALPALPIGAPKRAALKQAEQAPPKVADAFDHSKPAFTAGLEVPVALPALPIGAPKRAAIEQAEQAPPKVVAAFDPSKPAFTSGVGAPVALPALPIGVPKRAAIEQTEQAPPRVADAFDHNKPMFTSGVDVPPPKAVIVINAVSVPAESAPAIPDAELAGSFAVGPSGGLGTTDSKPAKTNGSGPATDPSAPAKYASRINLGSGSEGQGGQSTGAAHSGSLSIAAAGAGSADPAAGGAGSGVLPGISISGGVSGGGGRAVASRSLPHNPYAVTIVSSGSSGGFTRNFGVFSRTDTVYTVYMPMADAGGGPDWPMEYALLNSAQAGNGLVTPPIAIQKIQATLPRKEIAANSAPVYVTGTIDENGVPKDLRPILATDVRSKCAVQALSQWVFKPAQLEGKPVASKVLVGVALRAAEDTEK